MKPAALILAALLVAATAHAQALGGPIGDPRASGAYDPDAGVVLAMPTDGGAPDPVVICQGQRAPASGTFLTVDAAALLAGKLAGSKQEVADLKTAAAAQPATISPDPKLLAAIGVVVFLGGVVTGAYAMHALSK